MKKSSLIVAGVLSMLAATSFAQASAPAAGTHWGKTHPRRVQVNRRLDRQNKRIHQEVREGDMSKARAARLHRQDHQVRQEERTMASQNGGHITKQEQRTLNQQENKLGKKIGQ